MVVLLPDSGERYLSKMYNDDWMREHRFLVPERITLRYVLESKRTSHKLLSVAPSSSVRSAIELMTGSNVSQLPILENGTCIGHVEETELMAAVIRKPSEMDSEARTHARPPFPVLHADELVQSAIAHLSHAHHAVLVEEAGRIIGIMSRYDVIEYMSR